MGSDADIHYTLVDDSNRVLIENVWPRAERCPTCAIENSQTSLVPAGEVMGRFPRNSILAATHSVEFAQRWGRRVRNDIALESNVLGDAHRQAGVYTGRISGARSA